MASSADRLHSEDRREFTGRAGTKEEYAEREATMRREKDHAKPISLLSPFTVRAKMLLQDVWTAGLDWDEEMLESLALLARGWFSGLCDLKKLHIPRCLQEKEKMVDTLSIHTFVDSSESAYGAVVYARCLMVDQGLQSTISCLLPTDTEQHRSRAMEVCSYQYESCWHSK